TLAGRMVLVAVVTAMVAAMKMQHWWAIGVILFATSLFPLRRKQLLLAVSACWVFLVPPIDFDVLRNLAPARGAALTLPPYALLIIAVTAATAILFAYAILIRRFPASPVGRKPVLGLTVLLFALFAATQLPM